ncbi:hypothetical protein KHV22_004309, partial [Salmonella enterica]|nr:hypothetical protein [Salmonella enterica]
MLGGADNPNGELLSYIIGADTAARTVLENGLRGGLPEPSRPAAVSFARLEPASGN